MSLFFPPYFPPQVDDVTEIAAQSSKVKYYPQGTRPSTFCLFPYGHARLRDADTDFFDGGYLSVQSIGPALKGDHLGFLAASPHDNSSAEGEETMFSTGETFALHVEHAGDVRRVMLAGDGEEERHVATLSTEGDPKNPVLKVQFVADPAAAEKRLVSLNLASYLMNCVTFSCTSDLRKPTSRTYQVKISDGENIQEGKKKITVETAAPACHFVPWAYSVELAGKAGEATHFLDSKTGKLTLTAPADKPVAAGFVDVRVESWCGDGEEGGEGEGAAVDAVALAFGAPGFVVKDGSLLVKDAFVGKVSVSATHVRVEFSWATKATGKQVLAWGRSLTCVAAQAGAARLRFEVGVDGASATCLTSVVRFASG